MSDKRKGKSLFDYLKEEITRGYRFQDNDELYSEKQKRVLIFMRTPRELEKLMLYGVLIMFDTFLVIYSFLPLRVIWSGFIFLFRFLTCQSIDVSYMCCWYELCGHITSIPSCTRAKCYQALCHLQYVGCKLMIGSDSFMVGIFVQIFDRLAASIGQDVLDSFYYVLLSKGQRKRDIVAVIFYGIIATSYIYAVIVLCQVITLNVAINSQSKALLTVMVSNQFVELKGNVFKKFDENNLFQMSSSDIRERFHYVILLSIVMVRNLAQFHWDLDHLQTLLPLLAIILLSEVFVDWIKHGFITKFNSISPHVYRKYTTILAKDLVTSQRKLSHSQYSDLVSRRMGFTPLPLTCLLSQTLFTFMSFPGIYGKLLLLIIFICLLSLKILLGIVLLGVSSGYNQQTNKENEITDISSKKTVSDIGLKKSPRDEKNKATGLSKIERYSLCSNRIV